jgi:hypothetical protein
VVGLLIAVLAPGGDHGLAVAAVLTFVGVGLRIEAALRAMTVHRSKDAQPYDRDPVSPPSVPAD